MTFLIGFLTLYFIAGAFLYFTQRSLLYFPDTNRYGPGAAGLDDMTDVRFETPDGLTISGWYKKAPPGRPTFLYFHGNGGNNLNHSVNARPMIEAGYGVLLLEYRGYGGNPGSPTEEGLYQDGRGALNFLKTQGVADRDIILFGYSLGTGVAIKMASEISAKTLILQAPYTSIAGVAQSHYWYMPVKWLIKDQFAAGDLIGEIRTPMLFMLGTADTVIPPKFTYGLFELAGEPKTLEVFEGLGHNDLGDPEVLAAVFKFLNTLN